MCLHAGRRLDPRLAFRCIGVQESHELCRQLPYLPHLRLIVTQIVFDGGVVAAEAVEPVVGDPTAYPCTIPFIGICSKAMV